MYKGVMPGRREKPNAENCTLTELETAMKAARSARSHVRMLAIRAADAGFLQISEEGAQRRAGAVHRAGSAPAPVRPSERPGRGQERVQVGRREVPRLRPSHPGSATARTNRTGTSGSCGPSNHWRQGGKDSGASRRRVSSSASSGNEWFIHDRGVKRGGSQGGIS